MKDSTYSNTQQAFVGEAKAYFRLQAFARKAQEEGYPQIAALFRAISEAEKVHAEQHLALLEKVKSTEENLKYSFEKESFVNQVSYPEFLRQAWADEERAAIRAFTLARNAEERHAKFYKAALTHMIADRQVSYFVCSNCGWVEESLRPETCPNCQESGELFVQVD
jgi:rubrerythrin